MKFTEQELEAVCRLRANNDWMTVLTGLANHGEDLMKALIFAKTDREVAQGRCQAVTLLLEAIAEAPQKLNQIQTSNTNEG